MKILIVKDDDKKILELYKNVLESKNHQVWTARNNERCVQIYHQELDKIRNSDAISHPFDVVILDYKMPRKDGLETAKEIFELVSDQRIMFVSANTKIIRVSSTKRLKHTIEVLRKPFSMNGFIDKVEAREIFEQLETFGIHVSDLKDRTTSHKHLTKLLEELLKIEAKYFK